MMLAIEMRPLTAEYLEFVRTLRNDYRIRRWLNTQDEISFGQQQRWYKRYVEDADWRIFVALQKPSKQPIGYGHIKCDDDSIELGCVVKPEMWNQGYGTAIVQWLVGYSKGHLGIDSIWLEVHADNDAAIRLYKHCGFKVVDDLDKSIIREGIAVPQLRMVYSG